MCELIERHVFLCLVLLGEKHWDCPSSLHDEVHFNGQPQILHKGIWGMYKGTGSV